MKLETILDAMVMADRRRIVPSYLQGTFPNAQRQYHAFRSRILRMDAELRFEIDAQKIAIEAYKAVIEQQSKRIAELEASLKQYRDLQGF